MNATIVAKRKAGNRPHPSIERELCAHFKDVRLWWVSNRRRWALLQVRPGQKPWLITVLEGPAPKRAYVRPTLANTIYMLRKAHWTNFVGHAGNRMLQRMDEQWENARSSVDRKQEGLRRELASELYSAAKNRVIVPR